MKLNAIRVRTKVAALTAVALAGSMAVITATPASADTLPGPAPVQQRSADNVTADALPTVQIDGVVWSQAIVGNTVYAGGSFANARPAGAAAGTNLTPRSNLLSYDLTTGNLNTSFVPSLNGEVKSVAASPDGSRIYVGGSFTTANGQTRNRIAAYSTATGQLITTFAPTFNASVYSIVATNTTVYVGGIFGYVNGVARSRLAAINASNGALTGWAPVADYNVNAVALSTDGSKVYAAGGFTNLNGSPVYGVGALDANTGASLPFPVNNTVQAYGTAAAFLTLSTDSTGVYGTAYNYGGSGNFEGTFAVDQSNSATRWIEDGHGDTYGTYSVNGIVYTISHAHYLQTLNGWPVYNPWQERHTVAFTANATGTLAHNTQGGYADFYGQPAPSIIDWFPDFQNGTYTAAGQSSWSITGTSKYVVEGGEFPSVNGTKQQGLVRFAQPSIAPKKQGPMLSGANFTPTLVPLSGTSVRVSWPANWDRDDQSLTYNVYRNGNLTTPVYTIKADSQWWNTPNMGFIDTGLTPGQTYSYRLQATDGDGNFVRGDTKTVTVSAGGTQTAYDKKVLADGASTYWPMGESSGSTLFDNAGFNDAVAGSGITRGAAGPVSGTTATTFDGTSNGTASTQTPVAGPNTFTASTWVNTTSTSGGQDPRLRECDLGYVVVLRPAPVPRQRGSRDLRCLQQHGVHAAVLGHGQRRQVASDRRQPGRRRHDALHRRHPGRASQRRHVGSGLQRLLARRR